MRKFLAIIGLVLLAGGVLWYAAYRPQLPWPSQASSARSIDTTQFKSLVQNFDHSIAQTIRQVADEGISLPQVGSWQAVSNASQATISANLTTSPDEIWQTFREQGSQAVLGGLANSAEVSVNNVSTEVMNEARYQYCLGVVEEHERQQSQSTSP